MKSHLRVSHKLITLIGLFIISLSVLTCYQVYTLHENMMADHKYQVRNVVDALYSTIVAHAERAKMAGENLEDIKREVAEEFSKIRYEGKNYVWITDGQPKMIMHPFKPELNGMDLSDYKDPTGRKLFVEMEQVAKQDGSGFVSYIWPNPNLPNNAQAPKVSYVRYFAPWDWVIGSGVYIDDIEREIWRQIMRDVMFSAGILVVLFGVAMAMARTVAMPLRRLSTALYNIAYGADIELEEAQRKDEFGDVARAVLAVRTHVEEIAANEAHRLEKMVEERTAELQEQKVRAEAADRAKGEFLANMTHELRTPLNSVLGMTRLMLESKLDEEQHHLAQTVYRSSTNLLEIVNDILDLSKIEAGEMQLEKIGIDVVAVMNECVDMLERLAIDKNLQIVRHYGASMPYVLGDPMRLLRVMNNLVGNAIKYTERGKIDIRADMRPLDDRHAEFYCEVNDTGIGIAQDKLYNIFQKFFQADSSTTRKYGGTGLGLAITRQLVELMGGKIGVRSKAGEGSTFWFSVPFELTQELTDLKSKHKARVQCGTLPAAQARILVAEDHPMNQIYITRLLKRFGIGYMRIVATGREVVEQAKDKNWDMIFMDCHMPEKNGYDATRDIRMHEKETRQHVPIVAITANAMMGDREKCLQCGMDEYISKPINIDELRDVMGQWIRFANAAPTETVKAMMVEDVPLDVSKLKEFSLGDEMIEHELVNVFVEQSEANIEMLRSTCQDGLVQWRDNAHMLKGSALQIGATILANYCSEAQHMVGTAQQRSMLLEKISAEYARVKAYLVQSGLLQNI